MAVWLITGCSSGFGDEVAKAALARGDKVIATARNASKLSSLADLGATTLSLDITASDSEIQSVIRKAVSVYGAIDILLNNAGYILEGAVEEASSEEILAAFNTNVFGHMTVTRAVLPVMRAQKSGVVATMGSIAGWRGGAGSGYYSAVKFSVAALMEALRDEVSPLGIQALVIEPGYFRTNFLGAGAKTSVKLDIDDYRPVMSAVKQALVQYNGKQPGDPVKGAQLIVEALTGSGRFEGKKLPVRLALGSDAVKVIAEVIDGRKRELDEWTELSKTTDIDE